ncbi:NRDE family protein [Dyadobacter sp. CY107]|uniref:NRDE family protein n=1 Tax=Dyadobacter fanqingshengii TaxID=2906443 RepID=UPI001F1D3436|nr:NRDE family protein [Dyadobacter fanqingshengii]MCF2506333.1 NRDE family protein [Dyadobacter fanqingshengii]
MCTVTYIPAENSIFLTSNRDERIDRAPAVPPECYCVNKIEMIYPKDAQAGGTWIVLNGDRSAAVLLNGGFKNHFYQTPYRKSRGLIMLDIMSTNSPADHFQAMDLKAIEPFTIILLTQGRLRRCTWDGDHKHLTELDATKPHIWASVTLYDRDMQLQRENALIQWLKETRQVKPEAVADFHLGANMRYETSNAPHNANIRTVSVTMLALSTDRRASVLHHDLHSGEVAAKRMQTQAPGTPLLFNSFYWKTRRFWIRLRHWEYWPFACLYLPLVPLWLWLSLRARSLLFFSAANPGIAYSGFIQERKSDIYPLLPEGLYPKGVLCKTGMSAGEINSVLRESSLDFPLIAKPDIGERGIQVELLRKPADLAAYRSRSKVDFLLQEYIDYSHEIGIFYYRIPGNKNGQLSGIVGKEFLSVTGDGQTSLLSLLMQNDRAVLQLHALAAVFGDQFDNIPDSGEILTLVPYGNHSRGSRFIDLHSRITPGLTDMIDKVCTQVPGFYFGRLDIRFKNWEELEAGRHFSIIELNGTGSEPTHIYDPAHSLFFAWKEIYRHWKIVFKISMINAHNGKQPLMSLKEGLEMKRAHDKHLNLMQALH